MIVIATRLEPNSM